MWARTARGLACGAAALVLHGCGGGGSGGEAAAPPAAAPQNPACTSDSTLSGDGTLRTRTTAYLCGTYGITTTRTALDGTPIGMDYFVSNPASGRPPKATVVL